MRLAADGIISTNSNNAVGRSISGWAGANKKVSQLIRKIKSIIFKKLIFSSRIVHRMQRSHTSWQRSHNSSSMQPSVQLLHLPQIQRWSGSSEEEEESLLETASQLSFISPSQSWAFWDLSLNHYLTWGRYAGKQD